MELLDVMQRRRAYRSLDPVEIDGETVRELARCASLSASCYNNQPWRYAFVTGEERLEMMKGALARGNAWGRNASMIVAVHAAKSDDCEVAGREYYLFDTGMATAMMILRAVDLGLVAHPIAGYDEEAVREILDIPAEHRIITLVIVGGHADDIKPELSEAQAEAEKERPERLPFGEFARLFD